MEKLLIPDWCCARKIPPKPAGPRPISDADANSDRHDSGPSSPTSVAGLAREPIAHRDVHAAAPRGSQAVVSQAEPEDDKSEFAVADGGGEGGADGKMRVAAAQQQAQVQGEAWKPTSPSGSPERVASQSTEIYDVEVTEAEGGALEAAAVDEAKVRADARAAAAKLNRAGHASNNDGKISKAILLFRQASELDPSKPAYAISHANMLAKDGNTSAALAAYDKAETLDNVSTLEAQYIAEKRARIIAEEELKEMRLRAEAKAAAAKAEEAARRAVSQLEEEKRNAAARAEEENRREAARVAEEIRLAWSENVRATATRRAADAKVATGQKTVSSL